MPVVDHRTLQAFILAATVLVVANVHPHAREAERVSDSASKESSLKTSRILIGCWTRSEFLSQKKKTMPEELCFSSSRRAIHYFSSKDDKVSEGLRVKIKKSNVKFLFEGLDGVMTVSSCDIHLDNKNKMSLSNCDFQGSWQNICRNLYKDKSGCGSKRG